MATPVKWGSERTLSTSFFDIGATTAIAGGRSIIFGAYGDEALFSNEIGGQIIAADGTQQGGEFRVNTFTSGAQADAEAATLTSGNYVVVWKSSPAPTFEDGLKGQVFTAEGVKVGGEFAFGPTVGAQRDVNVTALSDGRFVTYWENDDSALGSEVRAQVFSANGTKSGAEILLNNPVDSQFGNAFPSITATFGGGFLAIWEGGGAVSLGDTVGSGIIGQRFSASGVKLGSNFLVNSSSEGNEVSPSVTRLTGGNYIATWSGDNDGDPSPPPGRDTDTGVYFQVFGEEFNKVGGEVLAHVSTIGSQQFSKVVALNDGRFCIAWLDQRFSGATAVYSLRGQLFDANGVKDGAQFQVNTTPFTQAGAADGSAYDVVLLSDGRLSFTYKTETFAAIRQQIIDPRQSAVTLTGTTGIDTLVGTAFNDTFTGLAGADKLIGGLGDDTYVLGGDTTDILTDTGGNDTIDSTISRTLADGSPIENIRLSGASAINATGNSGNNRLTGNAASNILDGGLGNDTLDGGSGGTDQLKGGAGNDTYVLGARTTGFTITDISGTDTITSTAGRSLAPFTDIENLILLGSSAINGTGNALANTITGNAAANILDGGLGTDTLIGGLGNDTYIVNAATDIVTELAGGGTADHVRASASYTLAASADIEFLETTNALFTTAINLTGNGLANTLTGNAGANVLTGAGGNDRLDPGSGGADTLRGGAGDDTYVLGSRTSGLTILEESGVDTVHTLVSRTLAGIAGIEKLTLLGTANINGTGNGSVNTITGNAGNNVLDGGADGVTDVLIGGAGNDTYVLQAVGDYISDSSGTDTIQTATSRSLVSFTGIENLTLTGTGNVNATGDGNANTITGNSGSNIIEGAGGADTLLGGLGNDRYVYRGSTALDGAETINDAGGTDAIVLEQAGTFNFRTFAAITGVDALEFKAAQTAIFKLTGVPSSALQVTGATGAQTLYFAPDVIADTAATNTNLSGFAFTNWGAEDVVKIDGTFGINTITGTSRNDVIWGDDGGDIMNGGLGADTFVYGNTNHSTNAAFDTITGFSTVQGDRIDLRPYIAFLETPFVITGNNGADAFTGIGGEVRWQQVGANVDIQISEDGAFAMTIRLAGLTTLDAGTAILL